MTAPAIKSAWRRARSVSVAATWMRAPAHLRDTSSAWSFFSHLTRLGATQGDPTKAPDLTTNSWVCPPDEGCSPNTLQSAVEGQRAAGIEMVAGAGNNGSDCKTLILSAGDLRRILYGRRAKHRH